MCSLILNANKAKANLGSFAPFMLFAAKKKLPQGARRSRRRRDGRT
jgi:hypothetical protein